MSTILIVEDEAIIRDAYVLILEASGYQVFQASNGKEAFDMCQDRTFDVILLDLMMPVMDGVSFLRAADFPRQYPNTRVVLLTNLSTGEGVREAKRIGVSRHEVKSDLAPKDIVSIVETELQQLS